MPRHTLTRTLVAALAVTALAAPTALARPAEPAPAPAATDSHAVSSRVHDLRGPRAGNSIRTSSLAATSKTPGYTPGETSGARGLLLAGRSGRAGPGALLLVLRHALGGPAPGARRRQR